MRVLSSPTMLGASFCATVLFGCAGGSSSVTSSTGPVPAAHAQPVESLKGVPVRRRTASVPSCGSALLGVNSFIGGGSSNAAAGGSDGIVSGVGNKICDNESVIGGGSGNAVASGTQNTASTAFIGAGSNNLITGTASGGFIGGGENNFVTESLAALGAGSGKRDHGIRDRGIHRRRNQQSRDGKRRRGRRGRTQ